MKIYRVIDDGEHILTTDDLAKVGAAFLKLSKKHQENTWYWVDEEEMV